VCPGRCSGGFGNSSIVFHVSKSTIGQVGIETFLRLDVEKMRGRLYTFTRRYTTRQLSYDVFSYVLC